MKPLKHFIKKDPAKNYYYHPEMNSQYEFRQESDIDKRDQIPRTREMAIEQTRIAIEASKVPRIIPKITPGTTGKGYISLSKKPR